MTPGKTAIVRGARFLAFACSVIAAAFASATLADTTNTWWVAKEDPNAADTAAEGRGSEALPPAVPISYAQTMLSESYKRWVIGLLSELGGGLPGGVCYMGDGPATCLSGTTQGGERIFFLNLLDLDGDDAPEFDFGAVPASIRRLRGDGTWENVAFAPAEGGGVRLDTVVRTQIPAIFRMD